MTVVPWKTTFPFVLAKDPKRRRSRSAFNTSGGDRQKASRNRVGRNGRKSDGQFVLYVEGARDREIIGCWARRIDSALMRCIEENTVILGGRRPARAIADFQKRGGVAAGYSGLIVLDRDDHPHTETGLDDRDSSGSIEASHSGEPMSDSAGVTTEAGLEIFVWSLRHIESYLLVPEAIRRMLGLDEDDRRVERSIEASATEGTPDALDWTPGSLQNTTSGLTRSTPIQSPASPPSASRHASLHAKRILGSGGSLSEALGTELRAGEIARAMRPEEFHGDVRMLFDRIGTLSGLSVPGPEVVIRS